MAVSCVLFFVIGIGVARADAPTPEPAMWSRHELAISLRNLPHLYSCEDLRRKFTDVLLHLGARPTVQVSASRCERALGAAARSPRVRLEFELARVVPSAQADRATFQAVRQRVRLAAGEPSSLELRDCALLRRINRFLIARLPVHVVEFNLACVSRSPTAKFRVVIEVVVRARHAAGEPGEPPVAR